MNRSPLLFLLWTIASTYLCSATLCQGQSSADLRNAWRYTSGSSTGYFVNSGQGVWVEHVSGGQKYLFTEASRDSLAVVLNDPTRGIQVKIESAASYWKLSSSSAWNFLYTGGWVDRTLLPRSISGLYQIRPVYFVPLDRMPTANYEAKIRTVNYFISKYFKDAITGVGLPADGLSFELEPATGLGKVLLVRGKHQASHYNASPNFDNGHQWRAISTEIYEQSGSSEGVIYLIFAETYEEGSSRYEWPGAIAQGVRGSANGGMAICSSWILKNEFCSTTVDGQLLKFADATPVVGRSAIGHGGVNSPRFEFIEDGIGAAIHEIGHCLGMIHDHRNDSFDLMGNGFRNIRHNFLSSGNPSQKCVTTVENLRIAATSRFVNPSSNLADNSPPFASIKLAAPPKRGDKKLSLSVNLMDSGTLRWITYFLVSSDSVVSGRALAGTRQTFVESLRFSPLRRGAIDLRVFVGDSSGNISVIPVRIVVR